MSRSCTLNPELIKQLTERTIEEENRSQKLLDNEDAASDYLTMRSYPINLQRQEVIEDGGATDANLEVFVLGAHREVAPSYMTVRRRIQSAPNHSHNLLSTSSNTAAPNLPEPLLPTVSSSAADKRPNRQPTLLPSQRSLGTDVEKNIGLLKPSSEEALVPSSVRFIYPRPLATSTTASTTISSSTTTTISRPGVDAPPIPVRPAGHGQDLSHVSKLPPRPVQRTKVKFAEGDTSAQQVNGSHPPVVPPRPQSTQHQQQAAASSSPLSLQKAKPRPVPPPRRLVNPTTHVDPADSAPQLSPKKAHGSHHGTNAGLHDSEIKLQTLILSDPEFQSCTPEVCKHALKIHRYEINAAKEEIRVHMLMEMQVTHITAEDCRRALSHCQQKTDRAAAWLLEQSDEIERRRQ